MIHITIRTTEMATMKNSFVAFAQECGECYNKH